jgi:acetyltransferase-like isoleucine patch superfamily enzyme
MSIGRNTTIRPHAYISAISEYAGQTFAPNIRIGDDVYIGSHLHLASVESIDIGNGCVFSDYVYLADVSHGTNPEDGLIMCRPLVRSGAVSIGEGTFVGYRCIILPGVALGKFCIVGAGSVVTRSFPDYSMIAGNPARLLKRYSFEVHRWIEAG